MITLPRGGTTKISRWFAVARVLAIPLALTEVVVTEFPPGYESWAWASCGALTAGALTLLVVSFRHLSPSRRFRLAEVAVAFDTLIVTAFVFVFAFKNGQPLYTLYFLPIVEAALRFGLVGGLAAPLVSAPMLLGVEIFRADRFEPREVRPDVIAVRVGLGLLVGAVIGRLVALLAEEGARADERAREAERLHDELGRRVDLLEAANRCARALASSLELDQSFNAFIRELGGLVPFDRVGIGLADGPGLRVVAASGVGVDRVLVPGSPFPAGALAEQVIATQRTVYREDMTIADHPEEGDLVAVGLRCRLVAPLLIGPRATGILAILRREPSSFSADEIELVTLLGRLAGTAVQNIRAYDAEHRTVEELRRLSALRADFVSLVSHELRSPMAAVIGSARTLQQRWRELTPEQREAFLALIADETTRLATLIGDVLDTSRIEAGTFSYTFEDVAIDELVREVVASAGIGQDEVDVEARVEEHIPTIRGDRERLKQVLMNLVDNAVKYSPGGATVDVAAAMLDGHIRVSVSDHGPGIPPEDRAVIFEKFGRAHHGQTKPGTGLGLFIARSIAEAHGGRILLESGPGGGATFMLELPTHPAA